MEESSEETARIGRPPKKWHYSGFSEMLMHNVTSRLTEQSKQGWEFVAFEHDGSRFHVLVRKGV